MKKRHDDRPAAPKEPRFGNDALKKALQHAAKAPHATTKAPEPARAPAAKPPPPPRARKGPVTSLDDDDALFLAVMDDVAPVQRPAPGPAATPATGSRPERRAEDAEALAKLAELVASPDTLAVAGLSGRAAGIDGSLGEALARGDFRIDTTVRFTDASALERALVAARRDGVRCVRVEGRAEEIARLLSTGRLPRLVLAFHGRPAGLTGGVDVLLRR